MPAGRFIVARGMPVQVGYPVKTWHDTGWRFASARDRATSLQICAHWTGGENPPGVVYRSMSQHSVFDEKSGKDIAQPLSVHFIVSQKGLVYQTADTQARCVHAGEANATSIGIEFIGRGNDLKKPQKGFLRTQVVERIHNVPVRYDELLDAQVEAGVKLIASLCTLYQLPLIVPENADGTVRLEQLPKEDFKTFRGVIGHLHCHPSKVDPGARILRAVQAAGRALPVA